MMVLVKAIRFLSYVCAKFVIFFVSFRHEDRKGAADSPRDVPSIPGDA